MLSGCASQALLEKYKGQPEQQIFTDGETAMAKGNLDKASEHFEALQALYPFGPYAQQGQLDSIYTYYENGDYPSAEAAAERYIHLYPEGPYTDYALYMKGLAEFTQTLGFFTRHFKLDRADHDLTSYQTAFVTFEQLIQHYPNSIYTPDARLRMIYMRNLFAKHYLNIAGYYYSRKAYIASAEQAAIVVNNYQGTPYVGDALVMMINSYNKLKLSEQANDALAVLKANYPDKVTEIK